MDRKTFYDFFYILHLARDDVDSMGVKEVSSPEEIDQGDPGDISKYLRQHSDGEEET